MFLLVQDTIVVQLVHQAIHVLTVPNIQCFSTSAETLFFTAECAGDMSFSLQVQETVVC